MSISLDGEAREGTEAETGSNSLKSWQPERESQDRSPEFPTHSPLQLDEEEQGSRAVETSHPSSSPGSYLWHHLKLQFTPLKIGIITVSIQCCEGSTESMN